MPVYNQYFPDAANTINTPDSVTQLALRGPVVPVAIGVSPVLSVVLQSLGREIPDPVVGWALIDTGATYCAVDEQVVQSLNIPPYGVSESITPAGPANQLNYAASISFPGTPLPNINFTDFIGCQIAAGGIVALIGRSVLRDFVMVYNGPGGSVSLAY
jgi:hypothetical protein